MGYPRGTDYLTVMQHPHRALTSPDFAGATVEQTPLGLPMPRSGGAVFTFHLTLGDGRERAVRCFNREFPDLFERYAQISAAVARAPAGLFSAIDFQPQGIRVNQGTYPILVMDWVAGKPLAAWIESHLTASAICPLIGQWDQVLHQLSALGIAHGDLQHGNILVDAHNHLRLIDYDSMYLPTLRSYGANDAGHRNYQHPRRGQAYDERLDHFSGIVIGLALRALAEEPQLWREFGLSGENMLLRREDFVDPQQSQVLARLERIPAIAPFIPNFRAYCLGRYADVPTPHSFFTTRSTVQVAKVSGAVQQWATTTPICDATVTEDLRARVGQLIEVIGLVREVEHAVDSRGRPFVRLLFTGRSGFVALIFSAGLERYHSAGRSPDDLKGCWVTITQVIEALAKDPQWRPRPQVIIEYAAQVGVLTADEARTRLGAQLPLPRGLTTGSPPSPSRPTISAASVPAPPAPASPRANKPMTDRERYEHMQRLYGHLTPAPPPPAPIAPSPSPIHRSSAPPAVPAKPRSSVPPRSNPPVVPLPRGFTTQMPTASSAPPPPTPPASPAPASRTWWEAFMAFLHSVFSNP